MDGKRRKSTLGRKTFLKFSPFNSSKQTLKLEHLRKEKEKVIATELYELTRPSSPRNKVVRQRNPTPPQTPSITIYYGKDGDLDSSCSSASSVSPGHIRLLELENLNPPPSPPASMRSDRSPRELLGHSPRDLIHLTHPPSSSTTRSKNGKQERNTRTKSKPNFYVHSRSKDCKNMIARMEEMELENDFKSNQLPMYHDIHVFTLLPDSTKILMDEIESSPEPTVRLLDTDRSSIHKLTDMMSDDLDDDFDDDGSDLEEVSALSQNESTSSSQSQYEIDRSDTSDYEAEWTPLDFEEESSGEGRAPEKKEIRRKPFLKRLTKIWKRRTVDDTSQQDDPDDDDDDETQSIPATKRRRRLSLSLGRSSGRKAADRLDPPNKKATSWRNLFGYFDRDENADRIVRPQD